MDRDQIKGKWMQIKGEVKRLYGQLTDDDLMRAEGDMDKVAGAIQQKYGESKDKIKIKLDQIVNRIIGSGSGGIGQPVQPQQPAQPMQPDKIKGTGMGGTGTTGKSDDEKKRDVA